MLDNLPLGFFPSQKEILPGASVTQATPPNGASILPSSTGLTGNNILTPITAPARIEGAPTLNPVPLPTGAPATVPVNPNESTPNFTTLTANAPIPAINFNDPNNPTGMSQPVGTTGLNPAGISSVATGPVTETSPLVSGTPNLNPNTVTTATSAKGIDPAVLEGTVQPAENLAQLVDATTQDTSNPFLPLTKSQIKQKAEARNKTIENLAVTEKTTGVALNTQIINDSKIKQAQITGGLNIRELSSKGVSLKEQQAMADQRLQQTLQQGELEKQGTQLQIAQLNQQEAVINQQLTETSQQLELANQQLLQAQQAAALDPLTTDPATLEALEANVLALQTNVQTLQGSAQGIQQSRQTIAQNFQLKEKDKAAAVLANLELKKAAADLRKALTKDTMNKAKAVASTIGVKDPKDVKLEAQRRNKAKQADAGYWEALGWTE